MYLTLESCDLIQNPTEEDVLTRIEGQKFAILAVDDNTYLQCAEQNDAPREYVLEYQEEDLGQHYRATDSRLPLEMVLGAFTKYVRGDSSWKSDFTWQELDL